MDSTLNCALLYCTQLCGTLSGMAIIITAISFFFGIIMYTETILNDLQSLFQRIDVESIIKRATARMTAKKYCIEAINLHTSLLEYFFLSFIFVYILSTIMIFTDAWKVWPTLWI